MGILKLYTFCKIFLNDLRMLQNQNINDSLLDDLDQGLATIISKGLRMI